MLHRACLGSRGPRTRGCLCLEIAQALRARSHHPRDLHRRDRPFVPECPESFMARHLLRQGGDLNEGDTMSESGLARIRNHELDERRRLMTYFAALAVAGSVAVVAFVVAIVIVAQLIG